MKYAPMTCYYECEHCGRSGEAEAMGGGNATREALTEHEAECDQYARCTTKESEK